MAFQRVQRWPDLRLLVPYMYYSTPLQSQTSRLFLPTEKVLFGRGKELCNMVNLTTAGRGQNSRVNRLLLHGPHGVGKTALIRSFTGLVSKEFPKQYLFQAQSEESLLFDINLFLEKEKKAGRGIDEFKKALSLLEEEFLLIFEDVFDPCVVFRLLPVGRHCVVFTAVSDLPWRVHIGEMVTSFPVEGLATEDSLRLVESVFSQCGKRKLRELQSHMHGLFKLQIDHILEHDLRNIPLAVRQFSFRLAEKDLSLFSLLQRDIFDAKVGRSEEDEKAAGPVHVLGYYHNVRASLSLLSNRPQTEKLCFAFSLLPINGVQFWFVELLCLQLGLNKEGCEQAIDELIQLGLLSQIMMPFEKMAIVKQPGFVLATLRTVMQEYGQSFASVVEDLLLSTFIAKLQPVWDPTRFAGQKEDDGRYTVNRKHCGFLSLRECLHLEELIISFLDLHHATDGISNPQSVLYILASICLALDFHHVFNGSLTLKVNQMLQKSFPSTKQNEMEVPNLNQAHFLRRCKLSAQEVFHWSLPVLRGIQKKAQVEIYGDILSIVVYFLAPQRDLIQLLLAHLGETLGGLLQKYIATSRFSFLFVLLRIIELAVGSSSTSDMINAKKLLWWILSAVQGKNMAAKILQRNDLFYVVWKFEHHAKHMDFREPTAALEWLEFILSAIGNIQHNVSPHVYLGIVNRALKCCLCCQKPVHGAFLRWFGRLVTLSSFEDQLCLKRSIDGTFTAFLYVSHYSEKHGLESVRKSIVERISTLTKEKHQHAASLLISMQHPVEISVRTLSVRVILLGVLSGDSTVLQRLVRMYLSCLKAKIGWDDSVLQSWFDEHVTKIHRMYFLLSLDEKLSLLALWSSLLSKSLEKVLSLFSSGTSAKLRQKSSSGQQFFLKLDDSLLDQLENFFADPRLQVHL